MTHNPRASKRFQFRRTCRNAVSNNEYHDNPEGKPRLTHSLRKSQTNLITTVPLARKGASGRHAKPHLDLPPSDWKGDR